MRLAGGLQQDPKKKAKIWTTNLFSIAIQFATAEELKQESFEMQKINCAIKWF